MSRTKLLQDRFRKDQNGAIAIIFTLGLLFFCVLLGVAVDGSRAVLAKNKAAAALDSAAIAAATTLMRTNPPDGELAVIAQQFFRQNSELNASVNEKHDGFTLNVDRAAKVVTVSVVTHLPTTFFWVVNRTSIDFTSRSQASFQINDIELGMALDLTGSMGWPDNSGTNTKIEDLKVAANELFDIMLPDNGSLGDVRIGMAPFSTAVNAGGYAAAVTNGTSTDNCTFERTGIAAWTDASPDSASTALKPAAHLPSIDPANGSGDPYSDGSGGTNCPTASVTPLTNDKSVLRASVTTFQPKGWTAGHLGTAWGWYLITPNWDSIWPVASAPRAYATANLVKAMVVMTDGQFNTAFHNGLPSADQAVKLCQSAKAEGVIVYTIGFTTAPAEEVNLRACATTDARTGQNFFYHADDGVDLSKAFKDIATKLTQLRLSE